MLAQRCSVVGLNLRWSFHKPKFGISVFTSYCLGTHMVDQTNDEHVWSTYPWLRGVHASFGLFKENKESPTNRGHGEPAHEFTRPPVLCGHLPAAEPFRPRPKHRRAPRRGRCGLLRRCDLGSREKIVSIWSHVWHFPESPNTLSRDIKYIAYRHGTIGT